MWAKQRETQKDPKIFRIKKETIQKWSKISKKIQKDPQESIKTRWDPTEPVGNLTGPVGDPSGPVGDSAGPIGDPIRHVGGPPGPIGNPTGPHWTC